MCLTPEVARVLMRVSGLSFRVGIIGSILAQTGMPFWVRVRIACILSAGDGALGSSCLASLSSSVVMVSATIDVVFLRMSMSLVTRFDLVMIWMRQLCLARVWRLCRVSPSFFSIVG